MLLREFLNEFELDYAQAPARVKKYPFGQLRDKEIVLVGDGNDTFTRSIIYSFLNLNDQKDLNIKVVLVPLCNIDNNIYRKELIDREDFLVKDFSKIDECEYVILTGLCNKKIKADVNEYMRIINSYINVFENIIKITFKRLIFMSDYRVNGKLPDKMIASEYEKFDDINDFEQMILQSLESLCVCYSKQNDFNYTILRTAIAYGACVDFNGNFLNEFIKNANEKDSVDLDNRQFSFIYISDILTAIFYALKKCPTNKIYNIDGLKSTVSSTEILTLLLNNNLVKADINIINNSHKCFEPYDLSINSLKIRHYKWRPKVCLDDGLILLVKSIYNKNETFIFDNTYHGKLKTVHEILLAYILEVDRICKKHNIKYFLAGGTLLGAIRHNGFIPWDDDADVMMLREDYDKFLKVAQDELPSNLFVQNPRTEELNHHVFTKIRMDNTLFATRHTGKFMNMHNGIFIDILSQDNTSNNKLIQNLHIYTTLITRSMVFNKWAKKKMKTGGKHPILCKMANYMKDKCSYKFLEYLQDNTITLFKDNKKSRYLYDGMGRNLRRGVFPKEWLEEVIYVDFEGYKLPVPKYYDEYLTYLYGDYMQMIPVSQRRTSHSIVLMDLGEYTNFKLTNEIETI